MTVCTGTVLLLVVSAQAQNLFVSDFFNGKIIEISPGGAQSTFATGLNLPIGLAFDSAGNLFEADGQAVDNNQGAIIHEFTPTGTSNTFASGFYAPAGLAFNSAGDLFVADLGVSADSGDGIVYELTPNAATNTFASGLNSPFGLAFNSDGDLFVADGPSGIIYEFTPNGGRTNFASGLSYPIALAFNSSGDLFVLDRNSSSNNIIKITPGGVQSTLISGLDYYAYALAINSVDDLFVGEYDNGIGTIIQITPSGAQSTFASGTFFIEGMAFQPVPQLGGFVTNGVFQLTVSMPSPYHSTIIQTSTDLAHWVNIYTNTPPYTFSDATGATLPCRFYRVVLGP